MVVSIMIYMDHVLDEGNRIGVGRSPVYLDTPGHAILPDMGYFHKLL